MSETFTPGPWQAMPHLGTWISTVGSPYGHGPMHIADVRGWGHLTGRGACALDEAPAVAIQEANARLIAAAPDLLAALKKAQAGFIELHGQGIGCPDCPSQDEQDYPSPEHCPAVLATEAAISKAQGDSGPGKRE